MTEIVAMEGAVPLMGVAFSHAPPSAVLLVAVQFSVPVPPLPICTICEVAAPPVLNEKLSAPGRLSKNAPLADDGEVHGQNHRPSGVGIFGENNLGGIASRRKRTRTHAGGNG